jgi:DNA-binding transcriptional ArsR family regulator
MDKINEIAEFFKILSDPTRLRIVYSLLKEEKCVACLVDELVLEQSNISHQLKILKMAKLVDMRKDGKYSNYSLNDEHVEIILKIVHEHLSH